MGALKELMRAKNPSELIALLKYAHQSKVAKKQLTSQLDPHWRYAYEALCNVSRSFALVIMQLEPDLRHPICIFYLVLRALDTVEDDTSVNDQVRQDICKKFWTFLPCKSLKPIPYSSTSTLRRPRLLSSHASTSIITDKQSNTPFHFIDEDDDQQHSQLQQHDDDEDDDDDISLQKKKQNINIDQFENEFIDLNNINFNENDFIPWTSSQFGSAAEKELCQRFDEVIQCFNELDLEYQKIIIYITKRMGAGMANHIHHISCDTIYDYNLYCHFVAGLVGFGLTDIFVISSFLNNSQLTIHNSPLISLIKHPKMANNMGLFLQQTNIIRDYLEDIIEGRTFWPKQIWNQYSNSLGDLKLSENKEAALATLNHMVYECLKNVDDCLKYMSCIDKYHPKVFKFVAIPQVMAIATINEVYNNEKIFQGVVKIRRAKTCILIQQTNNMQSVYKIFYNYATELLFKINRKQNNEYSNIEVDNDMKIILNNIIESCIPYIPTTPNLIIPNVLSIICFCALSSYVLKRRQDHFDGAVFTWRSAGGIMEPQDMLAVGALFLVCIYMFGFFLLPYMTNLHQDDWRRLHLRQSSITSNPTQQQQ